MQSKVRIGIIGAGKMGTFHLQKYLQMPDVEVVGVYDTDPVRVKSLRDTLSIRGFEKLDDLLFESDGVTIASPTPTHYPVARQAIEAGVHVLVEKPLTDQTFEAEELVRLARQHKVILQVGFIERFRYVSLARAFEISPVRFIEGHRLSSSLSREGTIDVVMDLMIHDLDLALSLMGSEPTQISAVGVAVLTAHYDIANVRLEFPDGGVANLTASRVSTKPFRKFRTFSHHTYGSMDFIANAVEIYFRDNKGGIARRTIENTKLDALDEQCRHFVQCVREERQPLVTGEDGLRALRVAHAIREKIDERSVILDPRAAAHPAPDANTFA